MFQMACLIPHFLSLHPPPSPSSAPSHSSLFSGSALVCVPPIPEHSFHSLSPIFLLFLSSACLCYHTIFSPLLSPSKSFNELCEFLKHAFRQKGDGVKQVFEIWWMTLKCYDTFQWTAWHWHSSLKVKTVDCKTWIFWLKSLSCHSEPVSPHLWQAPWTSVLRFEASSLLRTQLSLYRSTI